MYHPKTIVTPKKVRARRMIGRVMNMNHSHDTAREQTNRMTAPIPIPACRIMRDNATITNPVTRPVHTTARPVLRNACATEGLVRVLIEGRLGDR